MAGHEIRLEGVGQRVRRDAGQGIGKGTLRMPKIMRQLKAEPDMGGNAAESGQPGQPGSRPGRGGGGACKHAVAQHGSGVGRRISGRR